MIAYVIATMKPSLFIASSSESVEVAFALQESLDPAAEVTVWRQGIFELSRYALESLLDVLDAADFGLFVFTPDDVISIRGQDKQVVRDNVLFELGMFMGRLGRDRNFIVLPKGFEESFHLPTDLVGLTPALYEPNRQDGNLLAALGPAASKIVKAIVKLGPVRAQKDVSIDSVIQLPKSTTYSDPDKLAILESWMGSRSSDENSRVIYFAEVDQQLRLPSGTTKAFVKQVACRWNYVVQHEGELTILFRQEYRSARRIMSRGI